MISANGLPSASVRASWAMVKPPPEYLKPANGGRAKSTAPTFEGFSPFRICGTVGRGCDGAYPGNPNPSSAPDVWLRRDRSVTGWVAVHSPSGTFHDFRIWLTSTSIERRPS